MEITQFTYFQQLGGIDMESVPAEITYGLERIAMYVQKVDSVYDLEWAGSVTYGDVHHQGEVEHSFYNFEDANTDMLFQLFAMYEAEAGRILDKGRVLPAYDYVLKSSHAFNLLDARNAISVTERTGYISRVRALACRCAAAYRAQREQMKFPLMSKFDTDTGKYFD